MAFDYEPLAIVVAVAAVMMYATSLVLAAFENHQEKLAQKRAWNEDQQLRELLGRNLWGTD